MIVRTEELGATKLAMNSAHILIMDEAPAGIYERRMPIIKKGFEDGITIIENFLLVD
jgi:hypothetical protein